jgi:hypothetical protein
MKSATETAWTRGRALIDRLKTAEKVTRGPSVDGMSKDVVDRLNELTDYVECGWLAARELENEQSGAGLSAVLGCAIVGLRELTKHFEPGRRSSAPSAR